MARHTLAALGLLAILAPACQDSQRPRSLPADPAPLVLAAGMESLEPTGERSYPIDLQALGVRDLDGVYRLTTPADTPFSFDVLTRAEGNAGSARVSLAHLADDGQAPVGRGSLASAGFMPTATGIVNREPWLDAMGDGFARITMGGSIDRTQVLVFETETATGRSAAVVEIAIGGSSPINNSPSAGTDHPEVVEQTTLYSSDSWQFGLPTAAVSGDRTSVVFYEGDRADWQAYDRFEMRLQYDGTTGAITGGGSDESSPDSGHWRDHEIAALFNVLALVHGGTDEVTVRLSFDRGATFAQEVKTGPSLWSTRLVQIAMAADYSLAIVYWQSDHAAGTADLMLLEGRPAAVDPTGSPTWFAFDPPQSVFQANGDVTPLLTGAAWSAGGDLVIGYGFTSFRSNPDRTWTNTTRFWSAVRPWGGQFATQVVDEEIMVGKDPSVALLDSGPDLKVFYAYEWIDGLRLRVSDDAGQSYSAPRTIGTSGAHTPTVFARRQTDGTVRVDVVYLTVDGVGTELHLSRWLDFDNGTREDYRLTTAVMVDIAGIPGGGGNIWVGPIDTGFRLTQVAWMGYDAILEDDEIVVVYDEETYDALFMWLGAPGILEDFGGGLGVPTSFPGFVPADPPPLAPGMTEALPAPDPDHRHQLKLLRLR